jgi:UDP:flavonoid glycosyltransferase YjiC (YdhE family)
MPMVYDQLDNGLRLKRLGVGEVVPQRTFTISNVAPAIARLLNSTHTSERARHWASQCDGPSALARGCDLLEGLVTRNPSALSQGPSHASTHSGDWN